MPKGKYIVIEGGEGCGKSTQAKMLYEAFERANVPCVLAREPGGVKEAEKIRQILLDKENDLSSITELFLFEAARREFFRRVVIPSLEQNISVISDRSSFSTTAYQGYGDGVNLTFIDMLNYEASFGRKPDLAFIIDIKAEKGLSKEVQSDRFAAKGLLYHNRVNAGFREIAKFNYTYTILIPYVENQLEATHNQIRNFVNSKLSFNLS